MPHLHSRVDTGGGSSFPPAYHEEDDYLDSLCRDLTDGSATRTQQLAARSYIEAYAALVDCTRDRRNEVVRFLRRVGGAHDERGRRVMPRGAEKARAKAGPGLRSVLESELESNVLELAYFLGYQRAHFRPAMLRSGRWATHMRGEKGFPDLVLAKRGKLIFAELKRSGEEATAEQLAWLEVLGSVPGIVAVLWSTEDWVSGAIEGELRRAPARATRRVRKALVGGETVVALRGPRGGLTDAVVVAGPGVQRRVLG